MASPNKEPRGNFRTLLDLFYRWQRAHYHLWNIKKSREGARDGVERTAEWLSRSHPVAECNTTTKARMEANARSWAENSRETMEIHYRHTIVAMIPAIKGADHKDWEGAWTVATKSMNNRYKGKFTVDILDWARAEITPLCEKPIGEVPATATQSQTSPSPIQPSTTISSVEPEKTPSKTKKQTPQKIRTTPKGHKTKTPE